MKIFKRYSVMAFDSSYAFGAAFGQLETDFYGNPDGVYE